MELTKSDLKKSFYGLVPTDWITCQFQEVLTGFSSGMTPYRAIPEYYKGNIPWITSGELNYNVITDTIEKITQEAVVKTNLKILPKGTFLMAITGLEAAGTRGSCAITGVEVTTNQSCMALFPKEGKIETNYLYHFYVMYGNDLAFKFCQGSKQQSYTGRIVKILPINLPPTLKEQKAIATALSDVDELIANLESLIAKKQAIKQGAMQQLLTPPDKGGKRLPGFSGEWVEKKMGEVFSFKQGLQCAIDEQFETDQNNRVRFIRIIDLTNNNEPPRYIVKPDFSHIIKKDDLFMVRYGTPGLLGYGYCGVIANNLFRLLPKVNLNSEFFYHLLKYKNQDILNLSSSTTMAAISFGPLSQMTLNSPKDVKEQKAIAEILSDMDTEIKQLETKKAKYQQLKQGMMQELLTGKTRLV